jgi:mRNA interferase HigB
LHIITRSRLTECGRQHADADSQLRAWIRVVRRKEYREHLEVRQDFPTVDFIGLRRVVFNICGNAYRLIVDMLFDLGRVYVRHTVTHAEYERLMKRGQL